jgi:predicted transcriptional regulator
MKPPFRLKHPDGWFAAGSEFARAIEVLSDAAFKLYAWICLHAERDSGRLDFDRGELARHLGRSRSALGRHLRELHSAGVCELLAAPNQHRSSRLQVRDAWWPYERARPAAGQPAEGLSAERAYVERVRQLFGGASCVQGMFTPSDARLAAAWHARGIAFESVWHAWLLGCTRKSCSLIDRPSAAPIRSLRYFAPLLEEVLAENFPPHYWTHLQFNLRRCEDHWRRNPATAPGRARPNLQQAAPQPAGTGHHERSKKTR